MAEVGLCGLVKQFAGHRVVDAVDLEIPDGQLVVLVGPSGCGKTTTLRMIAGLESVGAGEVRIGGAVVNHLPPRRRDVAMVFQDYALYPHMTVRQNLAFPLRMRRVPRDDARRRVEQVAGLLEIAALLERRPAELSGGQQQRVALGRAIVRRPAVFLLDEPLSNLDAQLRMTMRAELVRLHRNIGTTTIHVTHDQTEAMMMGDRIVVMNAGRIEQSGEPLAVYGRPASRFVAEFIGQWPMNFFRGQLTAGGIRVHDARWPLPDAIQAFAAVAGRTIDVDVGIRPEAICVHAIDAPGGPTEPTTSAAAGTVPLDVHTELVQPMGADALVQGHWHGRAVTATVRGWRLPAAGHRAVWTFDVNELHLFDAATGRRLGNAPPHSPLA